MKVAGERTELGMKAHFIQPDLCLLIEKSFLKSLRETRAMLKAGVSPVMCWRVEIVSAVPP